MIGIIGAGQLGRMLAMAAYPLGERIRVLDPSAESPAGHLAEQVVGPYDDAASLATLATGCDVVTYEFENVPVAAATQLQKTIAVYPPPQALEASQDRVTEKAFLNKHGIATAPWAAVSSAEELDSALERIGLPGVLKTRRMGYDGKGQMVIRNHNEAITAWKKLGAQPLIYEGFVTFDREVSCLAVRGRDGQIVTYPLIENWHHEGILRLSIAPAPKLSPAVQKLAEDYAKRVLDALDYVGLLTIEFFQVGETLIANEMAPRVHNSGHWSIEGAACSQFENHIRAITGRPLGATTVNGAAAMLNLIGDFPDLTEVLKQPGVHLHHYGKAPRAGRKIGHLTLVAPDQATLFQRITALRAAIGLAKQPSWPC
jgi:5-(carboxyamino)imidazole ribonucleotide synthase